MDIEDTTNPVEVEDKATAILADTQEVEAPQTGADESGGESGDAGPELDEDGNPIAEPADSDSEEIEHEGRKYRVPKALKDSFLRQADYTRKTQEVAEQRRAVEAERQAVQRATQEELGVYAQATSFGAQISQLDQAAAQQGGWAAWVRDDPFAANEAHMTRTELERARHYATGRLAQLQQQRAAAAQQDSARRVGEAASVLEREIGWSPTKAAEVLEGGIREYRFDRSEIESFEDARMVLALHDALQWRAHQKKTKTAQRHQAAQQVRPAARVQARAAPPAGLDDRLPADEWVRRRNEQLRRRG